MMPIQAAKTMFWNDELCEGKWILKIREKVIRCVFSLMKLKSTFFQKIEMKITSDF